MSLHSAKILNMANSLIKNSKGDIDGMNNSRKGV